MKTLNSFLNEAKFMRNSGLKGFKFGDMYVMELNKYFKAKGYEKSVKSFEDFSKIFPKALTDFNKAFEKKVVDLAKTKIGLDNIAYITVSYPKGSLVENKSGGDHTIDWKGDMIVNIGINDDVNAQKLAKKISGGYVNRPIKLENAIYGKVVKVAQNIEYNGFLGAVIIKT